MRTRFLIACVLALLAPLSASAFGAKQVNVAKGTDVWFAEDHTLPMIALVAAFPAGSVYDPQGRNGLASFAGSMLDEGAGKLDSKTFHTELADKAIQLSVDTDRDWMIVTLVTLSANAKDAMRLLGMALAHPRFDADALERVRAQMLQNLNELEEDPSQVAARDFQLVFFGPHPYAHPTDGDRPGLTAIKQADIRNFAAGHWVRNGLKIAVAGDIDATTLTGLIKTTFGPLRASLPPPPPRSMRQGAPGLHVFAMDVPQPNAVFALPGLLRSDKDFLPAYVANYVLGGGGFSSRLTAEVREKRGLTYDIATYVTSLRHAGLIEGTVATRSDAMTQTLAAVKDTMAKFAAEGPTEQELADAKTYLTGAFPLAFSSNAGTASQLSVFQRSGLPIGYVSKRNAMIDAVTLDDVKRVARKWFDPKRLTIVVAGTIKDKKH
jgi:zinc protease